MKRFFVIILCIGFILVPATSHAAELFFGVHSPQASVGSRMEFGVLLSTDGASVNAVEGDIVVPEDRFRIESVHDGGSIMSFWVEKPAAGKGVIHFSGIIPGGYVGSAGLLFTVIATPVAPGSGVIKSDHESILLNDGNGSAAVVRRSSATITIVDSGVIEQVPSPVDESLPEDFSVYVGQDENVFDNQWFITFDTHDKRSGIARYEVREGWGRYRTAQSPYRLRNQHADSRIMVRAIDNAGNIRVSVVPPKHARVWYRRFDLFGIIGALIILVTVSWHTWERKRRAR